MNSSSVSSAAPALARAFDRTQELLSHSLSRLSSGERVVTPSDDAQGVAIGEKLDAQIRRSDAATTNIQNAVSLIQTSDGILKAVGDSVSRLSELATLASNPLQNASDKALYQAEFKELQQQLRDTIGGTTAEIGGTVPVNNPIGRFNGKNLFMGGAGTQVNLGVSADKTMVLAPIDLRAAAVGDLIKQDSSGAFLLKVDDPGAVSTLNSAVTQIGGERATLGGEQSRLTIVSQTLVVERENIGASLSRIRDVDVAAESTQMAKFNLLTQSSTAMLTQANQSPNAILRLLQG